MTVEPYKRTLADRLATQEHAVFEILVRYCGRQLTPDLVDEVRDTLVEEMREGSTSWAFKPEHKP